MANIIEIIVRATTKGGKNIKSFKNDIFDLEKSLGGVSAGFAKTGMAIAGTVTSIIAASAVLKKSIQIFASFDDQMRIVAAVSGATAEEFDQLTEAARTMGETTRFTASQSAEALRFLSMAGLEVQDSLAALPNTLNLAAAASVDLGTSADILTNIMAGFGLGVEELVRVNNVLVATFTKSNTNLVELGTAFSYVGPIASGLGLQIEETAAALGLLANAGFKGEKGGAALRNILAALIAPSTKAEKVFKQLGTTTQEVGVDLNIQAQALKGLGISIKDASGDMRPIVDVMADIADGLDQLPDKIEQQKRLFEIFGKRAGPAMAALLNQGSGALKKLTQDIKDAGDIALDVAIQMEAGLGGSIRRLNSIIESLYIDMGAELEPAMIEAINLSTEFLGVLKDTVVVQLGGLVADIIEIANSFSEIEGSGQGVKNVLIAIALAIAAIRDGIAAIVLGVKEFGLLIKGLVYAELARVAGLMGKIVNFFEPGSGDSLFDFAKESGEKAINTFVEMEYQLGSYQSVLQQLTQDTAFLSGTTSRAGRTIQSVYIGLAKDVLNFSGKIKDSKSNMEAFSDEASKLKAKIEEAFEAGNISLEKKNKLLQKVMESTAKAKEESEKFGSQLARIGIETDNLDGKLSDTGKTAVDAFKKIAAGTRILATTTGKDLEKVKSELDSVEERALLAGDALVQAFQEGLDMAQTVTDVESLTSALQDTYDQGLITSRGLEEGFESARRRSAELSAEAIATSTNIGALQSALIAVKDSALLFDVELREELIPNLEKLGTQDLSKLKDQLDLLYEKAIIDTYTFGIVSESIANTIIEKLGGAARDLRSNITFAIQDSIEQFNLLNESANVSGQILVDALANIAGKAKTREDIELLRTKIDELAFAGKISFQEITAASELLDEKLKSIVSSTVAGQEAIQALATEEADFQKLLDDVAATTNDIVNESLYLEGAYRDAFEAGILSAQELDFKLKRLEDTLNDVARSSGKIGESFDNVGESLSTFSESYFLPWSKEVSEGIEELGININDLYDFIIENFLDAVSPVGNEWVINFDTLQAKMIEFMAITNSQFEEFDGIMQNLGGNTERTIAQAEALIDSIQLVDEQKLDRLRGQVKDLRQEMYRARQEASQLADDLALELLRLEGNLLAIEEQEYARRRDELKALLEQTTDRLAKSELEAALRTLEEIHSRKMQDILDEEQAQKDSMDRMKDYEDEVFEEPGEPTTIEAPGDVIEEIAKLTVNNDITINTPYANEKEWVYEVLVPILTEIGYEATAGLNA